MAGKGVCPGSGGVTHMFPQFQRVVTLSVMSILVGLFYWIYRRDRQQRARLWMLGWASIVLHFAGMLLSAFHLIPERLADWSAYSTLIIGAAAFFLSVCVTLAGRERTIVFWSALVAPAVAYWTLMVYEAQNPVLYRALLAVMLGAGTWLGLRSRERTRVGLITWFVAGVAPGLWAIYRATAHVESGIDVVLFVAFAATGWCYWRYFRRQTPGVLLTSLAFLAWGLVFPVAELCGALGINIPGDHVVWDLPKYFVAFGMIVTLFENQTERLQVEIAERKRAEHLARAANETKGILMASTSFAARRFLSVDDWQAVIPETLSKMGVSAKLSRVSVVQAPADEPCGANTILYEWREPGTAGGSHPLPPVAWAEAGGGERVESLRRGEVVTLRAPAAVLLAPIEVAGAWFGFLAFEDHRRDREWSDAERDAFRSAARMLGASITRQRAQEYVDNILRSMEESLLVTDAGLQIQRVNPSALRLLGYGEEELIGRPAQQVLLERELPARRSAVERTYRTKTGRLIPVLFSSAEMRNGSGALEGFVWLAQDMTELKRVQAELVRAKDAAEDANRAKSAFLANMSHELRTPLNAVIGYSEMLQELAEDRGVEDMLPDLLRIRSAGKHLLGLINDVLDLAKIEAGKVELTLEPLPVRPILHEVVSTIHPLVEKNGNRLDVESEEPLGLVLADQTRMRQVLFNLLSNACKFTERGQIRLNARRVRRKGGDWVEFRVTDTGIGMSPEQLDRLYRPFMQADASTTRKYGGTGLGLTISREFCHMMGGVLSAESELGKGSTFTIGLPGAAPDFAPPLAHLAAEGERQSVHA